MNQTDNTTTQDAAAVPPAADTPATAPETAPVDAANGAATEATPSLEQRLSELEARHAEVSEAYLRAKAETENVRRRAEEEVAKARKFAVEGFAESLLPVKDSLEAALATPNATTEQVLEGVQVTLRQLSQALERNKVVEVAPPAGTRFDPHQHQAISMVPADQEANTVVNVLQKGYLIAERVLRPALVTVAAPK
ncbi:nucleotide exchange factor GrpE [Azohydromonas caseinilytica]|uniref:Protein GrpE n=1 Tax=Azohydromonas caseinilytica TaxID=2728836 RepID=A0A848F8F6_9BURK|nr:nucleotide exchange factor GrpE [Azohydromonas caseinilytica]NML14321.1 nucleotide exchange factor GrpE [Azohydromonas caseinilytica]